MPYTAEYLPENEWKRAEDRPVPPYYDLEIRQPKPKQGEVLPTLDHRIVAVIDAFCGAMPSELKIPRGNTHVVENERDLRMLEDAAQRLADWYYGHENKLNWVDGIGKVRVNQWRRVAVADTVCAEYRAAHGMPAVNPVKRSDPPEWMKSGNDQVCSA